MLQECRGNTKELQFVLIALIDQGIILMYTAVCVLGSENDNLLPHIYIICTVSMTYFSERYQSQINKCHKRSQSPAGETFGSLQSSAFATKTSEFEGNTA